MLLCKVVYSNSYFMFFLRTTDTQWRHKSKKSENLGQFGRQNMLCLYLKIWELEWIFGHSAKALSSPGVRSPCSKLWGIIFPHCFENFFKVLVKIVPCAKWSINNYYCLSLPQDSNLCQLNQSILQKIAL